jgi:hypothetical protein
VNAIIRKQIERRKRRIEKRLNKRNKRNADGPTMAAANVRYEIGERLRATGVGGIGAIHRMVRKLGLDEAINQGLPLLKIHLPYYESDHVLNIAYNLLAGGSRLEHLEWLRQDESYLDMLDADRIPDPTTAGDFCRRFDVGSVDRLQEIFNDARRAVWQRQPASFFEKAIVDADGTMVETTGECKEGMDINHKGQWGYHALVVSLANTSEPLYVVNRPGNRPSHEHAPKYFDLAIGQCRRAGFKRIVLRGDTDFTQTEHLDRWDADGVQFVFGIDAMSNLYAIVEDLPQKAWKKLNRRAKYDVKTEPRRRPDKVKQQIVERREYEDIRLIRENVAEFSYRPTKCRKAYRVVVVCKDLEVHRGQQKLFNDDRCFFYITNDWESPAEEVVFQANARCNQENLLQQLKDGSRSLSAPVNSLVANWAYMVMASLAWSLKAWSALLLPETGGNRQRLREEKSKLLRMDFATFRRAIVAVPAQVVRTGRRIVCRLLGWNGWQHVFFRLLDQLGRPLRC